MTATMTQDRPGSLETAMMMPPIIMIGALIIIAHHEEDDHLHLGHVVRRPRDQGGRADLVELVEGEAGHVGEDVVAQEGAHAHGRVRGQVARDDGADRAAQGHEQHEAAGLQDEGYVPVRDALVHDVRHQGRAGRGRTCTGGRPRP